jgi:hypothetical protein
MSNDSTLHGALWKSGINDPPNTKALDRQNIYSIHVNACLGDLDCSLLGYEKLRACLDGLQDSSGLLRFIFTPSLFPDCSTRL